MKRRTFILFSSGALAIGTGVFYWQKNSSLSAFIKQLKGLDAIGEEYKKTHKNGNYLKQLEEKLAHYQQNSSLNEQIEKSIEDDFINDNISSINGWQLSQTECLIAASYVSFKGYVKPKNTAPVQNFKNAKIENFIEIKNWGPQKTLQNEIFNKQSDGHAGIWFATDNPLPNLKVVIDGRIEATFINERSITSGIHNKEDLTLFLNNIGKHEIALYDPINQRKQIVGYFEVLPIPKKLIYADGTVSKVFCPIESWGPQVAKKNQAFNVQPNGNAAIWIKTQCAPRTAKVKVNGLTIKTTVQAGAVTASVQVSKLKPIENTFHIELFDIQSKESIAIGKIKIEDK
jgi:hypothetical protein